MKKIFKSIYKYNLITLVLGIKTATKNAYKKRKQLRTNCFFKLKESDIQR